MVNLVLLRFTYMSLDIEENLKGITPKRNLRRTLSDEEDPEISTIIAESAPNYQSLIVDSQSESYAFKSKEYSCRDVLNYLHSKIKEKKYNRGYKNFQFSISLWNPEDRTSIAYINNSGRTEIRIVRRDNNPCKKREFLDIIKEIATTKPKERASVTPPQTGSSAPSPSSLSRPGSADLSALSRPGSANFSPLQDVNALFEAMMNGDDEKYDSLMKEMTPIPLEEIREAIDSQESEPQESEEVIVTEEILEEEEIVEERYVPPVVIPVIEEVVEVVINSFNGNIFKTTDLNGKIYEIDIKLFEVFLQKLSEVGLDKYSTSLELEVKKLTELNNKLDSKLRHSKNNVSKTNYLIGKCANFCTEENRQKLLKKIEDISSKIHKRPDLKETLENSKRQYEESTDEYLANLKNNLEYFNNELKYNQTSYDKFYHNNDVKLRTLVPEFEIINDMRKKITHWFKFYSEVLSALKTASSELNFKCRVKVIKHGEKMQIIVVGIKPSDNLLQLTNTIYEMKNRPISTPSPIPTGWGKMSPLQITQMVSKPGVPSPDAIASPPKKGNAVKPAKIKTKYSDSDSDSENDSEYESSYDEEYDYDYPRKFNGRGPRE